MITPTRGALAGALSSESFANAASAAPAVGAVTLIWPILRFAFGGDLPYQCTDALDIVSDRSIGASVIGSDSSGLPRMLSIAAAGTFISTEPRGKSSTHRK